MLIVDTLLKLEYRQDIGIEGRNSTVNIAYDPQLDTELVVKRIPKVDFKSEDHFFSEAQMLYATQHPNIMGVKYASQDEQYIYLTMDYYKNGSLNSLINERFLSVKEIIKYSLEFLSGIHYMHTKNLIHFDIKPTNILISNSNKAVVTDFGLAKYLNEHGFTHPDKLYPLHIPPEAFSIDKFSFYTDIYQAGLTIYRLCNGNRFFKQQLQQLNISNSDELAEAIKKNKFPKKDSFLPHIPDKFQQIIKKALNPDVSKRYSTILEMMNEISNIEIQNDWMYNENIGSPSTWKSIGDNYELILELKEKQGTWSTRGFKVKIADNTSRNVVKWKSNGHSSKEEAFKCIKELLKS